MENKATYIGLGFDSILTLVFITLKLCGVISWSWVWVLSPLWISIIVLIIALVLCVVILNIIEKI